LIKKKYFLVFLKLSLNQIDAFTRTKAYSLKKKAKLLVNISTVKNLSLLGYFFHYFPTTSGQSHHSSLKKKVDHIQIIFV